MNQQSLSLDELLGELRVALVRQHTRRRRRIAYTLAIVAAGLTATVALGATYGHWLSLYKQNVNFAQCMHSKGIPSFRDPTVTGDKPPQSTSPIEPSSPAFQGAYKACQQYGPNGQAGPQAPTGVQFRAALGFARCMRTHRFPRFPDPLTTYGPGLALGKGMYFPVNGTYRVRSPAFRQAAKACGVLLP